MIQATDGKWYAYIAAAENVKWADSTVTTPGTGFDFGEFCSSNTDTSVLGIELDQNGGLFGVAIARPYTGSTSSTNGESSSQACAGGSVGSGSIINNVVRSPPTPVSGSVPTGQIGIDANAWPMIHLFNSLHYSEHDIFYEKNGSTQLITLLYDFDDELSNAINNDGLIHSLHGSDIELFFNHSTLILHQRTSGHLLMKEHTIDCLIHQEMQKQMEIIRISYFNPTLTMNMRLRLILF